MTVEPGDDRPDLGPLLRLAEKGLEGGGRIFQGLFSSPWTGVPTALLIMAQLDPSGKLTAQFLANLGTFLSAMGKMLGDALAQFGKGVTPPPPVVTVGPGSFCVKIDINESARFFLSLFPIFGIVPASQACFETAETRDAFFNATVQKVGPFIGFYSIVKVDR